MKPILPGARGPAVEDIQKRLLSLGYDLGPTGVDGVFLGKTREAVIEFQKRGELNEDGTVGDSTWAALVDASFTLGDRMLYLRLPHFHGRDVEVLQSALNTLGFACGDDDSIFGRFTEHAVREFQRNCGQPDDGIVGPETVRAISGLRHVWEGKDAVVPRDSRTGARSVAALVGRDVVATGIGEQPLDVAERLVNVALASDEHAGIRLADSTGGSDAAIVLTLVSHAEHVDRGVPAVISGEDSIDALAARLVTALASTTRGCAHLVIEIGVGTLDERERQRTAVRLLDALCIALA